MHSNKTIQNELNELSAVLAGISNRNVYEVPEGYFNAMLMDIMQSVSGLAHTVQSVPGGYFDGLADSIMQKIKAANNEASEGSLLLNPLKQLDTYSVPTGYFEGFAGTIMKQINTAVEVDSENSIILEPLKQLKTYSVPVGYFDSLAGMLIAQIPQPAKVIVMKKRSSFFNYAVAAVITGILGLSVVSIVDKKQPDQLNPVEAVVANEVNFDKVLASISDKEIVNYLESRGEDVNAALVASAANGKYLPDEIDYLTDDKTLDNFLNELNIQVKSTSN